MSFERKDFLSPLFVFLSLDSWIPILIKGYNPMFFIFVLQLPHFGEETPFKMAPVCFFFFSIFFCHSLAFLYLLAQDVSVHPAPWKMVLRNQDLGREASLTVFFKSSLAPYNICFF